MSEAPRAGVRCVCDAGRGGRNRGVVECVVAGGTVVGGGTELGLCCACVHTVELYSPGRPLRTSTVKNLRLPSADSAYVK